MHGRTQTASDGLASGLAHEGQSSTSLVAQELRLCDEKTANARTAEGTAGHRSERNVTDNL